MIFKEFIKFRMSKFISSIIVPLILAFFSTCRSTCNDYTNVCGSAYSDMTCFLIVVLPFFLITWIVYSIIIGAKKYYDK
jgi:hypothetical protein